MPDEKKCILCNYNHPALTFDEFHPLKFVKVTVKTHRDGCTFQPGDNKKKCKCPKHFYLNPGQIRISADTDSWEQAQVNGENFVKLHMEGGQKIGPKEIMGGWDAYQESRCKGKRHGTKKKYLILKNSIQKFLASWNSGRQPKDQLLYVHQFKSEQVIALVNSWDENMPEVAVHTRKCPGKSHCTCPKVKPLMALGTKEKRLNLLDGFFEFALQNEWIKHTGKFMQKTGKDGKKEWVLKDNPVNFVGELTGAQCRADDKNPLTDVLWEAFLVAVDAVALNRKRDSGDPHLAVRGRVFYTLIKLTGLAPVDAYTLKKADFKRRKGQKGYFIEIERTKTGVDVAPFVDDEFYRVLINVPSGQKPTHPDYVFWCGPDPYITDLNEINKQECDSYEAMDNLWREAFELIPRDLLWDEEKSGIKKDEYGRLIMPTMYSLRYNFSETVTGHKDCTMFHLAEALGNTPLVAQNHYYKRTQKRREGVQNVLKDVWQSPQSTSVN